MPDHRLAYLDQATYLSLRATGRAQVGQLTWVYEHPLDFVGLKRFHQNFGYGLAGRRIERSPLPFGRHRWVSSVGPATEIDVVDEPRPREELSDWLDERSQVPVDPEHGPGWHLGVLPMVDGSTAVSLVASHCLFDGLGLSRTVAGAVTGDVTELRYPRANARSRRRALVEDAGQTLRDARVTGRALTAGVKLIRQRRETTSAVTPRPRALTGATDTVVVPVISLLVALDDWDRVAERIGGNSYSLLAGFSARLAARFDRCHPHHGTVALSIAMSDRTEDDTRANALQFATASIDPAPVCTDLTDTRGSLRKALTTMREVPDATVALMPLTPFVPKRAVRRSGNVLFGDLPVTCSNVGDLDPAVLRVDGTDAERMLLRAVDQNVVRAEIEAGGGQLVVAAGRIGGMMSIGVVGYQTGATNTKSRLRSIATEVLVEFGLTGEMI